MDKTLKPNGVSHTVYPDNPAKDYNEWMEHITASSIKRDADTFKQKLDALWANTYFMNKATVDDYKREFDAVWDKFIQEIENHAK